VRFTAVSAGPGLATILIDDSPTLAVWADEFLLPLTEVTRHHGGGGTPPSCARAALSDWGRWCGVVEQAVGEGAGGTDWLPDTAVTFLPALTDPPTIYCIAANYRDHVKEMRVANPSAPARNPLYFLTPPASLTGHRRAVARPAGSQRFDWEVELAVIIGRDADHIAAGDAYRVIAGYAVADDLSVRDFARREDTPFFPDWLAMKGHTGCLPLGPAIIPADCVPDPMNLELTLSVNGQQRQVSNTKNMIFSIPEQIEYLSRIVPLRPGDVILTGTPDGTAAAWGTYLSPGDTVVAEVQGLGRGFRRRLARDHRGRRRGLPRRTLPRPARITRAP
jgi:2-keto-4-pentenoate hydratase/2-oxohepta-3-ene-1,7-dioic acid hydratase in catechol pathway